MAKKTSYLGLILPALGEFFNQWNKPVNENFQKIDAFSEAFGAEVEEARGGSTTLDDRLSVALESDGTLKDVPEVVSARSSKIYGSGNLSVFQSLDERLEQGDMEVLASRQGLGDMPASMAWGADFNPHNTLVSGPTNPLTFSGAVVTLNGSVTPVVSNINGYRQVTGINDAHTIAGVAGTYHLSLERQPTGKLIYTIPATVGAVGILTSTNKLSKFTATGTNLVASGVKVGDVLEVTAPGGNLNLGRWIVAETVVENPTDLTNESVNIKGEFTSSSTGLSAAFYREGLPVLSSTTSAPSKLWESVSNKIYIGRCVFDGTNVTSLVTYPYNAKYEGWQSISLLGGDFSIAVAHSLGFIPKRISLFASQANDFSQALEPVSIAKMSSGSVSLSVGDQSATYTPPALRRSVVVSFTDTVINIKNATNGIFYEDFSGVPQTSGYLYVVVER